MANPISRRSAEGFVDIAIHRRQQVLGEMLGSLLGTLWLWAARRRTKARSAAERKQTASVNLRRGSASAA